MPIYEFECPIHGRFEEIFVLPSKQKWSYCSQKMDHGFCEQKSEKVFSLTGTVQIGKSTAIFRNPKTGEIRTLTQDVQKHNPPKGFVVEEIKGQMERLRFEKEMSTRQAVENEITTHQRREMKSQTQKNRHDDIRANLSKFDSGTQNILKKAMERSKKKELPAKKTEYKLDISHVNKSNMEVG